MNPDAGSRTEHQGRSAERFSAAWAGGLPEGPAEGV